MNFSIPLPASFLISAVSTTESWLVKMTIGPDPVINMYAFICAIPRQRVRVPFRSAATTISSRRMGRAHSTQKRHGEAMDVQRGRVHQDGTKAQANSPSATAEIAASI